MCGSTAAVSQDIAFNNERFTDQREVCRVVSRFGVDLNLTFPGREHATKLGHAVLFLAVALAASMGRAKPGTRPPNANEIERGRYLVEQVAMCAECHTPRNAQGELDRHAWLQGAPIWIMPVKPISNWAERAPALAGFPGLTEEEGERVLEKGTGPEGETLRPPMHIYHMDQADAKAIIAYLKSLPQSPH